MNFQKFKEQLSDGAFDEVLKTLYGSCKQTISGQKQRYSDAVDRFRECYPDCEEISVFSAPGRTEIGGNHTDHQHGCVLAAAVNLDIRSLHLYHQQMAHIHR